MLPAIASCHAGDFSSTHTISVRFHGKQQLRYALAPINFLLSSYAQNRQIEYVICLSHVPEMPSNKPRAPAVRTVFLSELIMPLSPVACKRTLVRSRGLYAAHDSEHPIPPRSLT